VQVRAFSSSLLDSPSANAALMRHSAWWRRFSQPPKQIPGKALVDFEGLILRDARVFAAIVHQKRTKRISELC